MIREKFIRLGRWLHSKSLLAATDGNFSFRDGESFWITESGAHKGFDDDLGVARVALNGKVLQGRPSSESTAHQVVYERCCQARCVIHAHPPTAVAWSIAHPQLEELVCDAFSEVILAVGRIPIVEYARPGGQELAKSIEPFVQSHRAIILGRHGALSWGESIEEALNGIERIEHAAVILAQAALLGGAKPLPAHEVQWLRERRRELGDKTL